MKKNKQLFILFFISVIISSYSQDTNIIKYFPLAVGNTWVYRGDATVIGLGCFSLIFYHKIYIDSSKIFYGKVYFKFNVQTRYISGQGTCGYSFIQNGSYYRIDSISGNIYKFVPGYTECPLTLYERLSDSLNSRIFDTAYTCLGGFYNPEKGLSDTSDYTFLTFSLRSKKFYGPVNGLDYFYDNRYSQNLGLVNYGHSGPGIYSRCLLNGCVIGGVLYGDTAFSIIGINQISSEVPNSFELHQNYPNPFNPVTQIKFNIPKSSFVNLAVYDALGREVELLINEQLSTGSYKYDWNASAYPSGVYFYKLVAGEYTETKKMVLIK
jgi:hypothetical protein